eukprot:scpid70391/ scgid19483/ 
MELNLQSGDAQCMGVTPASGSAQVLVVVLIVVIGGIVFALRGADLLPFGHERWYMVSPDAFSPHHLLSFFNWNRWHMIAGVLLWSASPSAADLDTSIIPGMCPFLEIANLQPSYVYESKQLYANVACRDGYDIVPEVTRAICGRDMTWYPKPIKCVNKTATTTGDTSTSYVKPIICSVCAVLIVTLLVLLVYYRMHTQPLANMVRDLMRDLQYPHGVAAADHLQVNTLADTPDCVRRMHTVVQTLSSSSNTELIGQQCPTATTEPAANVQQAETATTTGGHAGSPLYCHSPIYHQSSSSLLSRDEYSMPQTGRVGGHGASASHFSDWPSPPQRKSSPSPVHRKKLMRSHRLISDSSLQASTSPGISRNQSVAVIEEASEPARSPRRQHVYAKLNGMASYRERPSSCKASLSADIQVRRQQPEYTTRLTDICAEYSLPDLDLAAMGTEVEFIIRPTSHSSGDSHGNDLTSSPATAAIPAPPPPPRHHHHQGRRPPPLVAAAATAAAAAAAPIRSMDGSVSSRRQRPYMLIPRSLTLGAKALSSCPVSGMSRCGGSGGGGG